jgi:tight adherence protein B
MKEPAKTEFMRVVGQTNIGVSVFDAIDDLAARMPATETMMMARAIRIQSQTGGDLGRVLEQLAETIKDRRRIQRKINALTSEGRASAAILVCLPLFLGAFIVLAVRDIGHALLFTNPGHISLMIVVVLESLGIFTLNRIMQVDV